MANPKTIANATATAVLAVLAVAFIVGAASWFITYGFPHSLLQLASPLVFGAFVAFVSLPFAVFSLVVVGTPLFRLWDRRGLSSVTAYLFAGAILSLITALFLVGYTRYVFDVLSNGSELPLALSIVLLAGPCAALTARRVLRSPAK
jgi:hypothetical protein